jgi:hypothetical protein
VQQLRAGQVQSLQRFDWPLNLFALMRQEVVASLGKSKAEETKQNRELVLGHRMQTSMKERKKILLVA